MKYKTNETVGARWQRIGFERATRLRRFAFCVTTLVATSALVGCSGEDLVEFDARSDSPADAPIDMSAATTEAPTLDVAATLVEGRSVVTEVQSSHDQAGQLTTTVTAVTRDGIRTKRLANADFLPGDVVRQEVSLLDLFGREPVEGEPIQILLTARALHADGLLGTDRGTAPLDVVIRDGLASAVERGADPSQAAANRATIVDATTLSLEYEPAFNPDEGEPDDVSGEVTQASSLDEQPPLPTDLPSAPAKFLGDQGVVEKAIVDVKVCFNAVSRFTDSIGGSNGEDHFTSSDWTARELRGNLVIVRRDGAFVTNLWLGDGLGSGDPGKGCTDTLSLSTDTYTFDVYPYGLVNSNYVFVRDEATMDWGLSTASLSITGSGTKNVTLPAGSVQMNVYAAAAYAIYRHGGGGDGDRYDIRSDTTVSGGSQVKDGIVYISANHDQRKFVIAHEVGHRLLAYRTNKGGGDCSLNSTTCPGVSSTHSMTSLEYVDCAFNEGFAHFYSADIFNDHSESDCKFRYYKDEFGDGSSDIVDCEGSNGNYVIRFAETCGTNSEIAGRGTELDWMRVLWDVHTHGNHPHINRMLEWIDSADSWSRTNTYSKLDAAANSANADVNANWDTMKGHNGVDH